MKLSIVIPAHNEQGTITNTVETIINELRKELISFEIICVNDNSTDNTLAILKDLSSRYPEVNIVDREPPAGFGRAIKEGLTRIKGDAVTLVMADMSDDPGDIVRYFRHIEKGYDCVFGSRFIKGSKVYDYPKIKLFLNRLANNFIRVLFLMRYNDITNAFKMYRSEVVRSCMPLVSTHFNISVEIPLKAFTRKYKIIQVPINWYGRKSGVSKLKIRQITRKYFFTIFYVWLERILLKDEIQKY